MIFDMAKITKKQYTGTTFKLNVVYIYNILLKSCMILQHLEQNRVADNPISVKTGNI